MKSFITLALSFLLLQGAHQAVAQTHSPDALKEGYGMMEGKMVHIANGAISPMTADVTMENGTKVMQDGTVVVPGKKPQKLREGYSVNKLGKIVLLEYDMMTHEAIRQHSKKMLGNTETHIIITEDGTAVVVDPADAELSKDSEDALGKSSAISRKAALMSEKNTLVVQKADIMNRLTPKETEKDEDLKRINARLKQLEQELKAIDEPVQQREPMPISEE